MDLFKILILLVTVGNVFGGGDSKCSAIKSDIVVLVQAFESVIDGIFNNANSKITSC